MLGDRRAHVRHKINLPAICTFSISSITSSKKTTTSDLSDSGICLYTDLNLPIGLNLEIEVPEIFNSPRKATVRWIVRKYFNNFKVGVSFD
jgi:hypothetical protein